MRGNLWEVAEAVLEKKNHSTKVWILKARDVSGGVGAHTYNLKILEGRAGTVCLRPALVARDWA